MPFDAFLEPPLAAENLEVFVIFVELRILQKRSRFRSHLML
jgi:hypothetical protein